MALFSEQEILNRVFDSTNNKINVTAATEAMALSTLNDVTTTNETTGDLLYRSSGDWKNLGAGSVSSVLQSGGLSSAPFWGASSAIGSGINRISAASDVDVTNLTTGDIIYRNSASKFTNLIGSTNKYLITNGLSAAPYWGLLSASASTVDTGSSNVTHPTPGSLQSSKYNHKFFLVRVLASSTDVAAATTVAGDLELPITGTISACGVYSDTAGVSNPGIYNINYNGTSIVSGSRIQVSSSYKTSRTSAATDYFLTTTAVSVGGLFTFDVISAHTTSAKGLTFWLDITQS